MSELTEQEIKWLKHLVKMEMMEHSFNLNEQDEAIAKSILSKLE